MTWTLFVAFLTRAIKAATVFIFGSTGETITEKSGHLNMGTPGIMCMGALGGILGLIYNYRLAKKEAQQPKVIDAQ